MDAFTTHTGIVATMDRANVDTDQIIPKQFLKRIERTGFGEFLFYDWRYHDDGSPNPNFELNQPKFESASVLVAGRNFGSGSSREHAVWALSNYGFRAVIAPSFADIFYNNCFKNGVLPVVLQDDVVHQIFQTVAETDGYQLTVDLHQQTVNDNDNLRAEFELDPARRHRLLNGLDDIDMTLEHQEKITLFEQRRGE